MNARTDWSIVWPIMAAALAFTAVYTLSLVGGASVEAVLLRSTGALLVVGLASFVLRAIIQAALPEPPPPPGSTIDITLPETDLNDEQ